MARKKNIENSPRAETYQHPAADALLRPEVGTQAQFRKKKDPGRYQYDSSLGFAIPYFHNGQSHDDLPDFIIKLKIESDQEHHPILETKGFDPLEEVKKAAAERWIKVVNADGKFGLWHYSVAGKPQEVIDRLNEVMQEII